MSASGTSSSCPRPPARLAAPHGGQFDVGRFEAGATSGPVTVTASVPNGIAAATWGLTVTAPVLAAITASAGAGAGQTATVGSAFATALAATVTDSTGNPVPGVTVAFAAPTSGPTPTFPGGASTATAQTNASGVATAPTLTASAVGAFTVTASAGGIATPASFAETAAKASATVVLTSSPNPSMFGSAVTVTGSSPTGSVQFVDGSTVLSTVPLAAGVASYATSSLPTGTDSLTAVYSGDSTNTRATSAALSQVVNPALVSIAVSPNPASVLAGEQVTFSATGNYSDGSSAPLTSGVV